MLSTTAPSPDAESGQEGTALVLNLPCVVGTGQEGAPATLSALPKPASDGRVRFLFWPNL